MEDRTTSSHPISDEKIIVDFPEYVNQLKARLIAGAESYGDSSFKMSGNHVCKELAQEAIDISGWGFILWARIKDLERKLSVAEELLAEALRLSPPSPLLKTSLQQLKLLTYHSSKLLRPQPGEHSTQPAISQES